MCGIAKAGVTRPKILKFAIIFIKIRSSTSFLERGVNNNKWKNA